MTDWSAVARELDFEVVELPLEEGVRVGFLAEHGLDPGQEDQLEAGARKNLGRALQAVKLLSGVMGLSGLAATFVRGEHRGHVAHLFERQGESPSLGISLRFAQPVGCGLRIVREGLHHKLGKLLRLTQDLQLADPQLDPLVLIQASDEARARDWLANEALRAELIELFQLSEGVEVLDWGLRYTEPRGSLTPARARVLLDAMASAAASAS